jgi:hypothetical protein
MKEGFSESPVATLETEGEPHAGIGLPGHVIRNAGRASRLLGAKTPTVEETRRRDALDV